MACLKAKTEFYRSQYNVSWPIGCLWFWQQNSLSSSTCRNLALGSLQSAPVLRCKEKHHCKCEMQTKAMEPLPVGGLTFNSTAQARHMAGQRLELHFYCSSVKESAWSEIIVSPAPTYLSQWEREQLLTDDTVRTSSCFGNGVWTSAAWLGFTASFAVTGSTKMESGKAETDYSFQGKLRAKVLD